MEDPICCNPKVDTFLAVTPVRPYEPERPRKTKKELEEAHKCLEECLDYPILWDFFDDEITIEEKMEKVNKYLEYLFKKEELLINDEEKKKEYEKLKREIKHFLNQKNSLEWEYQQVLPTMLAEALNIPYPNGFWDTVDLEMKQNLLEQQQEYLLEQRGMGR